MRLILLIIIWSCSLDLNQSKTESSGPVTPIEEPDQDDQMLSIDELDKAAFKVNTASIGVQTNFTENPIHLSIQFPEEADYVDIMRCDHKVQLRARNYPYSLRNLNIKDIDLREKRHVFLTNDFFSLAGDNPQCRLISEGHLSNTFYDDFATSGDHFYIVRACANRARIVDQGSIHRNCSYQVYQSDSIYNYVSKYEEEARRLNEEIGLLYNKIQVVANNIKNMTIKTGEIWFECLKRERDRAKAKLIRESWIHVGAAVVELALEITAVKKQLATEGVRGGKPTNMDLLKHYKKNTFGSKMDLLQLFNALNGASLGNALMDLTMRAKDVPRSCYEGIDYENQFLVLYHELDELWKEANHLENIRFNITN